jgi:hypothetical protein
VADLNLVQGTAYYVTAGYYIPHTKLQSRATYEGCDRDDSNVAGGCGNRERFDTGLYCPIDNSHNRRIDVCCSRNDEDQAGGSESYYAFNLHAHLVF